MRAIMKIAVLVSGEYRFFNQCRKTMRFLDDPRVDIYVSTWDKTIIQQPLIDLKIVDDITKQVIYDDVGRSCSIVIDRRDHFVEKKYNSKMVFRWKRGLELIKNSGIEYDYMLVTRPDLFYNLDDPENATLDRILSAGDEQFGWYSDQHKLQDHVFFSTFEKMKLLLDGFSIDDWVNSRETDWHAWWSTIVPWTSISKFGGSPDFGFTFFRALAVDKPQTFKYVHDTGQDWRDLYIVSFILNHSRKDIMKKNWGDDIVSQAEEKFRNGYFEQYKYDKYDKYKKLRQHFTSKNV